MVIRRMEPSNVGAVAKLMSAIKPDWWDFEGANQQLQDVGLLAKLVGWYLEEDGAPKGWLLCAEYAGYACLTIENLGYDENGAFVMERQLEPLLQRAEQYARQKGLRNMRYIIGSTGMSCHGRPITDFAEELRTLRSLGRAHFDYFRSIGFVPTGFLPNCYGKNYHGIIMVKSLLRALRCGMGAVSQPENKRRHTGPGHPAPCFVLVTVSVLPVHCGFDEALYL